MTISCFIGVGANLDDPVGQCLSALESLSNLCKTRLVNASSLYQSDPMGPSDQPPYINCVVALETTLSAEALLDQLQAIEAAHDRRRDGLRWGARTLDLDLLLYGTERITTDRLTVPHNGMTQRSFVILPLVEIAPEVEIPGAGPASAFTQSADAYGIRKLELHPMQSATKHNFIAIEGPIGVGKTTLAKSLAETIGAEFIHDTEATNPYLESFYRSPEAVSLHTQLHFLLSRIALLEQEQVGLDGRRHVADFLLSKDRLFAELNLDETESWMYQQIYDRLDAQQAVPDLVIYLQAPVEILIQRIERRGLRFEQRIDSSYFQRVIDIYERFFHEYNASPLLIVNAHAINIADNPADFAQLTRQITEIGPGRHYFNPAPAPA